MERTNELPQNHEEPVADYEIFLFHDYFHRPRPVPGSRLIMHDLGADGDELKKCFIFIDIEVLI